MSFFQGDSPGGPVLPPLLLVPQGLSGLHNKYEGDASVGRGDAYLHNSDSTSLNLDNFKALYDLQAGVFVRSYPMIFASVNFKATEGQPANYDLDVLATHRNQSLRFSIEKYVSPVHL